MPNVRSPEAIERHRENAKVRAFKSYHRTAAARCERFIQYLKDQLPRIQEQVRTGQIEAFWEPHTIEAINQQIAKRALHLDKLATLKPRKQFQDPTRTMIREAEHHDMMMRQQMLNPQERELTYDEQVLQAQLDAIDAMQGQKLNYTRASATPKPEEPEPNYEDMDPDEILESLLDKSRGS